MLPNTGMSFTPFDPLTASELNDLVENIEALSDGTGIESGAITATKLASSAALLNLDSGAVGIPYVEIGRATLASPGDTLSITSLPARKYLRLIINILGNGTNIGARIRFNNDSGANYAQQFSGIAQSANGDSVNQTSIELTGATTYNRISYISDIFNESNYEKIMSGPRFAIATTGAGNAPAGPIHLTGKWANTSAQINRVDVTNNGTGDFATGSQLIILGRN